MKIPKGTLVADVFSDHTLVRFTTTSIRETTDVQKVWGELEEVANGFSPKLMVLNFGRVNMMCSSFLGKLISLANTLKAQGAQLRVCCLNQDMLHAFKMLRLHKLIKVFDSEEKALK